jgi:hypothetical protein
MAFQQQGPQYNRWHFNSKIHSTTDGISTAWSTKRILLRILHLATHFAVEMLSYSLKIAL